MAVATSAARSAVVAATVLRAAGVQPPLSVNDALSGVFGSVSMAAWICLLLPQLIQNYKAQSAEGLSMAFLFVWLLGDATNLAGALWTNLAPTAIALAVYFCIADAVLILQCLYYNAKAARHERARQQRHRHRNRRRSSSSITAVETADGDADGGVSDGDVAVYHEDAEDAENADDDSENGPLLSQRRRRSTSSIGLPGSHRRHSLRRTESNFDPLRRIVTGEDDAPDSSPWLHNTLSLAAVWVVGALGYFASYRLGAWEAADPVGGGGGGGDNNNNNGGGGDGGVRLPATTDVYTAVGLALGYFSAICYLCARIPQIVKNYREKSCDGLALLFFLLSLTGNITYGVSLVAYSQDGAYLLKALPWLVGSLGTIVEDVIIFVQFRIYAPKQAAQKAAGSHRPASSNGVSSYGAA
ncbi:vacuolar membrane pq loop repeat protein [Niveomyces insectorum RCEF 264]|uniref:Vacuolar membrane pq loop repeat protein n=1 Tax=Niveomyces insectorum RCEF 264 TaxID=1081102 RepID=A0A167UL78_9HYPO|nr:vacuolar membrane pq loop repeat protein [Niveomyces insectorum RCEF 264]